MVAAPTGESTLKVHRYQLPSNYAFCSFKSVRPLQVRESPFDERHVSLGLRLQSNFVAKSIWDYGK